MNNLNNLINDFRSITDIESWYSKQNVESIYDLINNFIYFSQNILDENIKLKEENFQIKKDSKSLRKYLSRVNINDKEVDIILHNTKYCKRCNEKITMEIYGLSNDICYGCLSDSEKSELLDINLGIK
jgi:hypothetical protein